MLTPKLSVRRALGLGAVLALALGGLLGVSTTSEAGTTTTIKLSPASGSSTGSTSITVTGRNFADTTGTSRVRAVRFVSGTACGTDPTVGTAAAAYNVVSATKMQTTTAAGLTAGRWMLCAFDGTTSPATLLGGGVYVTALPPTATTFAESTAAVARASVFGGTVLNLTGTNFTRTTTASVDGLKVKVTYVSPTKLTLVVPAHAAGTGFKVLVTAEGGSVLSTDSISFVQVLTVVPATGTGVAGNIVTLQGAGFNAQTFSNTAGTVVAFVPGGQTLTANTTLITSLKTCTDIMVEHDRQLSCKAPVLSGAYQVQLLTAVAGKYTAPVSIVSRTATYTAGYL